MVAYAGIGARKTPKEVIKVMKGAAMLLGKQGMTCNTGAAKGADQAFAEGAVAGYGQVQLFIPWPSYEEAWRRALSGQVDIHVLQHNDTEAYQSVYQFHPATKNLKQAVIKLHARNYCILRKVDFVICWTPNGDICGGTGQALRIAQSKNIKIYNLGNAETLAAFQAKINQRLGG